MTNPATPTASLVERLRDEDLLMSATPHQLHDLVNEAATALETAEREKEEWRTSFFRELGCAVERTELITELRRALEEAEFTVQAMFDCAPVMRTEKYWTTATLEGCTGQLIKIRELGFAYLRKCSDARAALDSKDHAND